MLKRAACLILGLALASCRGCKNEHPFVPFSIDGELSPGPEAGEDAGVPAEAGWPAAARAVLAPPNATEWTLEGVSLVAPEDRVFVVGIAGDWMGDGGSSVVAVVKSAAGPDLGEAWFFQGSRGVPVHGARIGGPFAQTLDPSCSVETRLGRIGAHSAWFEARPMCAEGGGPRAARWFGVLDVGNHLAVRAASTVLDPDGAPKLTLDAERVDLDHDGLDDLVLRATLEGGGPPYEPGPKVTGVVRWLDRGTGLSREADEPEGSLHVIAAAAMARAAHPKDAATVPLLVHQARAIFVTLCAEGRVPRLTQIANGHAIQCGTTHALEELALAETRAQVTMNDPLRAAAALDREGLRPSTKTVARVTEARSWIEKIAPPAQATLLRAVMALPRSDRGRAPSWGALAFESSGKLLVRTPAGVARVDPQTGDEAEAAGVAAWPSEVLSPDGARRLLDTYDPCDAFALRATVVANAGNDARDIALPIEPPLGVHCQGARGMPVHAVPIAWGPLGLELVVGGFPVLVSPDLSHAVPLESALGQPVTLGAPRSPDGRTLVIPVTEGILVLGGRARLLRAQELDGAYGELYDCAVSDDAARVACARGGRAFVGMWPPP